MRVIAEELGVDLDQVRVEHAPASDELYGLEIQGGEITGGSNTIRACWDLLRQAGAVDGRPVADVPLPAVAGMAPGEGVPLIAKISDVRFRQPVYPGDSIFVPEKIDRRTGYTRFIIGAKDWTQLVYQFGLGAAAFKVLRQ